MNTATLLDDSRCERRAWYSLRWQPPAIRPTEALYEAIEAGLLHTGAWERAESELYELATTRGLDSAQTDVLQEAEHLSSLAGFITYLLRPEGPWKRPEEMRMPDGSIWTPGAFLDHSESHLRRVVLCSRWDAYRQVEEEHDWRTLEAAIYGVPMDLIVVVLGQERDGRRIGPLSRGWTHPVSRQLRFRKRDGGGFDGNWEPVWREKSDFSKEQWLDALTEDGVLEDVIQIHSVVPERAEHWRDLAVKKLTRIRGAKEAPEENPSACFSRINPCPFRAACPRGEEPSESLGFIKIK